MNKSFSFLTLAVMCRNYVRLLIFIKASDSEEDEDVYEQTLTVSDENIIPVSRAMIYQSMYNWGVYLDGC